MRILITNDDGVYSPGIAALAQVASRFGEVRIVAPDVEMSSAIGQGYVSLTPLILDLTDHGELERMKRLAGRKELRLA